MNFEEIKQADQQYIAHTYNRFNFCPDYGKGATCWDAAGKEYIDFSSGIGVNSLGFADPEWVAAVSSQAAKLAHISNLYYTEPCAALAKALCTRTGYSKVFFGNSGAEANEGAIKAARKKSFDQYGAGRSTVVTLVNSFHGRTVTTLSATGQDHFHQFFFPFTEGFVYAQANNIEDVKSKITDDVCAVMMELVQGEGGVLPLDEDFVYAVSRLCEEKDLILIVDEVQTGVGRTGRFLCCEHYQLKPDIVTLAKGLGGGLPIGAVLLNEKMADVFGYGDHGTTFGGNPVACAGAQVVINRLNASMMDDVLRKGEKIRARLAQVGEVENISGKGMMLGLQLKTKKSGEVAKACIENGLIVLTAKEKVRLLPPLVITDEELDKGLDILTRVLEV
ncbi:MAG TPA: aspartate aminotransferase family protein [Firmicutes bacterium]|nr:aspartate aminotransferase family protein [Bacillota bacterium]